MINNTQLTQQQQQQSKNEDVAAFVVMTLLLVFSAFNKTAKPAFWVGLFMLVLVWFRAYSNGNAQSFFNALVS